MVTATKPATQSTDIAAFIRLLVDADNVFEIRALKCPHRPGGDFTSTASGYFRDPEAAKTHAMRIDALGPPGTFITINPTQFNLLARANGRIKMKAESTTGDKEIIRRCRMLIDIDVKRPSGISSTQGEMEAAVQLARRIRDELAAADWPDALLCMSGNGAYLIYWLDLPNDDDAKDLIKRVLHGLAKRYDVSADNDGTVGLEIDTSTFNASRICKLIGTTAGKGDVVENEPGIENLPHRKTWFEVPEGPLNPVPVDLLESVATPVEKPVERTAGTNGKADGNGFGGDSIMARCKAYLDTVPIAIEGQKGHKAGACAGTVIARFGFEGAEARELFDYYNARCDPPFTDEKDICRRISEGLKYAKKHGLFGDKIEQDSKANTSYNGETNGQAHDEPPADEPAKPRRRIEVISARDFNAIDYQPKWLINGMLVAKQPAICGGRSKTLKTSLLVDAAVSIATGTPFMGKFRTTRSTVAILSGESGGFTIQETARRICQHRGVSLDDADLVFGFDLPRITSIEDCHATIEMMMEHQADVLIVDPAYLCLLAGDAGGRQTSNVFDMGPLLARLSGVGEETDSTVILSHHCRKGPSGGYGGGDRYEPPNLEDLSMAGFAEWARQWLLLGRREEFVPGTGEHKLWLNTGGSIGMSGCWGVDINEGIMTEDFTGRHWDITVISAADAIDAKKATKLKADNEKAADARYLVRTKILKLMRKKVTQGWSINKLKAKLPHGSDALTGAMEDLETRGEVGSIEKKRGQNEWFVYYLDGHVPRSEGKDEKTVEPPEPPEEGQEGTPCR